MDFELLHQHFLLILFLLFSSLFFSAHSFPPILYASSVRWFCDLLRAFSAAYTKETIRKHEETKRKVRRKSINSHEHSTCNWITHLANIKWCFSINSLTALFGPFLLIASDRSCSLSPHSIFSLVPFSSLNRRWSLFDVVWNSWTGCGGEFNCSCVRIRGMERFL